ncbi:hypothetical protein HDU93_005778 [Gonapodya sp. JEL0774]|nr:hypothetical protein HDU93_005778 [Gonapodya sp. JEL0774]
MDTLVSKSDYFAGMFNDIHLRPPAITDAEGRLFLDRDPLLFDSILLYLRSRQLRVHHHNLLPALRAEAEFFGIEEMVTALDEASKPKTEKHTYLRVVAEYDADTKEFSVELHGIHRYLTATIHSCRVEAGRLPTPQDLEHLAKMEMFLPFSNGQGITQQLLEDQCTFVGAVQGAAYYRRISE